MDFPHLRDTRFPNFDTVDVYSFQNKFDYTRWGERTKVKLCNVLWNSDYKDVVKFVSDAARDAWFDQLSDAFVIELTQQARIVPDGFVKLPVPYDVMARYNYMCVDIPIATSADAPIDWESTEGVRRWYFFIDSIIYRAPNTTEVRVVPDVWTNFHNDVYLRYMMLERGHAPVAATDVDEYLSNPIANNEYLLSPDVNFGRGSIVSSSEFMPIGNGEKYAVMVSTVNASELSTIGSVNTSVDTSWTRPTYSNADSRDGYQLVVNGYTFGQDGDYSNIRVSAQNGKDSPTNLTCYAIRASECYGANATFLQDLQRLQPNFMASIQAFFIVSSDLLTLGTRRTIAGHYVWECSGNTVTDDYEIEKSMFGYPERYSRFAKLYTFPYATLELTDNDGKQIDIRIEDCGHIQRISKSAFAYPFLNIRTMFEGIGGSGHDSYVWKQVNGTSELREIGKSDWYDYTFDWDIPTYSLYMEGRTSHNLHGFNSMQNARRDALVGYHTSVRQANTACQNAIDLANTAESNAQANADLVVANTANTCNAQTANTALAIDANDANTASANDAGSDITANNNAQLEDERDATNTLQYLTTVTQNETSTSCAATAGGASIQNGAINGALSGASMGISGGPETAAAGAIIGGVIGAWTASTTAAANYANTMAMVNCSQYVTDKAADANDTKVGAATSANTSNQLRMNEDRSDQNDNTNDCLEGQTQNNVDAATANAQNTSDTMYANAERTRGTSNANSGYTRGTAVTNAQEVLENAQDKAQARYSDARNDVPTAIGSYGGDVAPDAYETRGIQVKIRTQSKSAIAQAGDTFARFGYALNQMWEVTDLQPMRHFCYWKATDVWVDDMESSNNSVNRTVERIFMDGVTVWTNPDEIGKVSIYDN